LKTCVVFQRDSVVNGEYEPTEEECEWESDEEDGDEKDENSEQKLSVRIFNNYSPKAR
jgi:U3 small nucleolar RNA-associated protein 14